MALFSRSRAKNLAWKLTRIPLVGPVLAEMGLRRKLGRRVVTPYKVRNFLLAHRESAARAVDVKSLPYTLNMDTTNVCNLACPFCPTGARQLRRERTRLPLEKAKAVIDAVKDHVLMAHFYNWGEPLLNPDIFEIIRYASDAGIYTTISSNLSVKIEDLAARLLDCGLDTLHVSLDGAEQRTLEQYRRHANFGLVLENIHAIVEAKRQSNSRKPALNLAFLVFRHNEHELPLLPGLQREWGVDSFAPTSAFIYDHAFVPEHGEYPPIQRIFESSCHYLYSELMVEADGHISPCCTNTDARFDVGQIDDLADVRAFWNGPALQALRAVNAGAQSKETPSVLCHYCQFVGKQNAAPGRLSPLSPAMIANKQTLPPPL